MPADVSAITYFAPIIAFLLVVLIVFAVLYKSKLLSESKWVNVFVSLFIASLFISAAGVTRYVETITPWFGALIVSLFFLMMLVHFVGGKSDGNINFLRSAFLVIGLIIFLISGVYIFSDTLGPYLPGSYTYVGSPFTDWLYSPPIIGAILLIAVSSAVGWVLVKGK